MMGQTDDKVIRDIRTKSREGNVISQNIIHFKEQKFYRFSEFRND